MRTIFIDTSAFCALTVPKDIHNSLAKDIVKSFTKQSDLFTSNYVLDETYTLLKRRDSHFTSVTFMKRLQKSNIKILYVDQVIEEQAKKTFIKYPESKISFTDCTSFVLIDLYQLTDVFAFDEHFRYFKYQKSVLYLADRTL